MTRRFTRLSFAIALLLVPVAAAAQQPPTPDQMKAMVEQTRPGAPHRELAALEGRWNLEITYNMGRPMKTTGTATNRMVLGGRFLVSESRAEMPAAAGMMGDNRLETMRIYGFDRRTNEYTIIELDTMGTYWVSAAGRGADPRAIVMSGETMDDHGGSRETRRYDMVLRVLDPDTYVTEIVFKFPNRPDLKIVEVLHRRIK
jgi:hypothetical protein